MKSYLSGNELVFATNFIDPTTGLAVDPGAVTLSLLDPGGVAHDPLVSNPAVGLYKAVYAPTTPGIWTVRWTGTGAVQAAAENNFEIRPTAFGQGT